MAACSLRRLVNLQTYRLVSQKIGIFSTYQACCRKMHVSPIVMQKYFSEKHEWIDVPDGSKEGTIGITEYAQDKLGDIVFVQLPDIGTTLEAEGEAGVLESVKAASDLYSPVSGIVTVANDVVVENPKVINDSPYEEGWLFKVDLSQPNELKDLMDEGTYNEYLKTCD